jgi:hypothetical protein
MKSGKLNFLEPSGPLQACNGTALPLLRRERRLKVCREQDVEEIFGPKRDEIRGIGEKYIMRSFIICTFH